MIGVLGQVLGRGGWREISHLKEPMQFTGGAGVCSRLARLPGSFCCCRVGERRGGMGGGGGREGGGG
jgi:hypothetical protein